MEGLVYLLNQAGIALAEANQRIAQLTQENEGLRMQIDLIKPKDSPVSDLY